MFESTEGNPSIERSSDMSDREPTKPLLREARVENEKDWPEWMAMGNVTMVEAARRMAMWHFTWSKVKKLPKTLTVMVRDGQGKPEFPHEVTLKVDAKVKPLRGDE